MCLKKTILLFSFSIISFCLLKAQNIQLFTEDFQTGGASFTINSPGPGSNTGGNQWIINNQYSGAPTYPNTTSQDNTNGGTIGGAPFSSYLHIHDAPSSITNCNYNPTNQSDRFAYLTDGFCTLGMDSVRFSFFYLSGGSSTAYGEVYYSANNGPWIQTGQSQYNNMNLWQYEDITNPAFSNLANLRFGFRWVNNNGSSPNSVGFAIDDINIVASYDVINPVTITINSIAPNPVCQGAYITIGYTLSAPLCNGTYSIQLSNSSGNFPSPFGAWVITISSPQTTGTITIQLPNAATPSACYRIRISRTSPPPVITGIVSACFTIIACPNIITTLQPVVTLDTNAVCIGSAIDVPFWSTGVYTSSNTYTAQLSDANGIFPASPIVVGSSLNSSNYDPAFAPSPGSVSGLIPNVPPGCNYYIRVVSNSPVAIGSPWGPFCIGQCDITTNNTTDLNFCVDDCAVSPLGLNSLIDIDVNNNGAIYYPGNLFTTQLLSSMTFGQIGANGILGSVAAIDDTTLNVYVPCKENLGPIPLGMNYMRIIGTNSSQPDNTLGSLIRVTIGAFRSIPQIITSYDYGAPYDFTLPYPWKPIKDTFCMGEIVMLLFEPYAFSDMSTYMWTCNAINGGNPFVSPSGANSNSLYVSLGGPGVLTFQIQETSYGCVGPWSPLDTVVVIGTPSVVITGPAIVCLGDTTLFQVPFNDNTYYSWTTNGGTIVDTSNNEINVQFTTPGTYTITINAINQCGSSTATKTIQVQAYPIVNAGPDQTICEGQTVILTASGANTYTWNNGVSNGISFAPPIGTTTYTVVGASSAGCEDTDQVNVTVNPNLNPIVSFLPDVTSGCAPLTVNFTNTTPNSSNCVWTISNGTVLTGCGTGIITFTQAGCYDITLTTTSNGCSNSLTAVNLICVEGPPNAAFTASPTILDEANSLVNFTNNSTGASSYIWSFGDLSEISTVLNPSHNYSESELDSYLVTLIVYSPSGCSDTAYATIQIQEDLIYYIPNTFTPNGDMYNQTFQPVFTSGFDPFDYTLLIFNRWGEIIFESHNAEIGWDGTYGGEQVQYGLYTWNIEFKTAANDERKRVLGHVNVIR